jgi:hypothetical protein
MSTTPLTLPVTPQPIVPRNPAGQMVDSQGNPLQQGVISPDKTTLAGNGGLVWDASGPKMTAPAPTPPAGPTVTQDTSQGPGIFSRIGNFLQQKGPALSDIANHLAMGAGKYGPLQAEQAEKELEIRQQQADLQGKVTQSNLLNQALQRQHESLDIANYQTPEEKSALAVKTARESKPIQFFTKDGQIGQGYDDGTGNVTPVMMNGSPVTMPQQVGFHITGTDGNGNPIVESYSKFGAPVGAPQAAPVNPNAPVMPGMGKVNPMDAGAAGSLPPSPKDYPQGPNDPNFRADYTKWLSGASNAKQQNAIALSGARNATRPITVFDPNQGADIISTLGRQDRANPGQAPLAGNQSGAAGIGQKRATFSELDTNLANVQKFLPAMGANGMGVDSLTLGAALNPGTGLVSSAAEAAALKHLSHDQQSFVFALRNLRQGATSLKNVLSSSGVSDKRVEVLESELPSAADLMSGDPSQVQRKLATFTSIYNEVKQAYPQLLGGGAGRISQSPGINQQAAPPPTMPSTAPPTSGGFAAWKQSQSQ